MSAHLFDPVANQRDGLVVDDCPTKLRHHGASLGCLQTIEQDRLIRFARYDAIVSPARAFARRYRCFKDSELIWVGDIEI